MFHQKNLLNCSPLTLGRDIMKKTCIFKNFITVIPVIRNYCLTIKVSPYEKDSTK